MELRILSREAMCFDIYHNMQEKNREMVKRAHVANSNNQIIKAHVDRTNVESKIS